MKTTKTLTTLTALLLMLLLASCTKTVYIPTESAAVSTDTLAVLKWRTDTVIDRDTVTLSQSGDTITREIVKWRWRVRETHDTVYQSRTDSVYIEKPYPVEKTVEVAKPLLWWHKTLMWLGIASLAFIAFLAIYWHKKR